MLLENQGQSTYTNVKQELYHVTQNKTSKDQISYYNRESSEMIIEKKIVKYFMI